MEYAGAWFGSAFEGRPEAVAVSDADGSVTAGELGERALEAASVLAAAGPRVVGLAIESGVDRVTAMHAAWLAGAAVLPIDPTGDRSTLQARTARCDLVIDRLPSPGRHGDTPAAFDPPAIDPLSPAAVLYTSGTSAEPTEVMLSHSNLVAQGVASMHPLGGRESDRWLSSLSFTHAGGLTVPVRCAVWGAEAVLAERFDPDRFLELMSDPAEAITIVSLVPVMLDRLLDAGLADPPTLRRAVVSGAPLPEATKARAIEAGVPVVEAWGMTETCGMATVEREPGAGGAGEPLPGVHVEVSDDGEIRVGGPTVAPGVQVGSMFDSGDLGRLERGSLSVTGRRSSLIISGGENVSPERVEQVLLDHPAVLAAVVRGEPSREWGEAVVCDVVLRDGCADPDLLGHCRSLLAPWEVPKRFDRVDAIASTPSGKPLRRRDEGHE